MYDATPHCSKQSLHALNRRPCLLAVIKFSKRALPLASQVRATFNVTSGKKNTQLCVCVDCHVCVCVQRKRETERERERES